jgi:glyoxylase-like metal-dependent hydrolase (beta-lactamase superfamily II)
MSIMSAHWMLCMLLCPLFRWGSAREMRVFLRAIAAWTLPSPRCPCTTKPTLLLHEGDRVGSLEVIATPGHTPGHIAFLDTRNRALIVGDAFQTLGGVAVSGAFKPLFPLVMFATWHKETALESARKLLALKPSSLSVGHGRTLNNPQDVMARAIRELEQTLAKKK